MRMWCTQTQGKSSLTHARWALVALSGADPRLTYHYLTAFWLRFLP